MPSSPPIGRLPSVFDYAFLTDVQPVTELVLIRHGQQYIGDMSRGPVGDIIDPPLSEKGERQADSGRAGGSPRAWSTSCTRATSCGPRTPEPRSRGTTGSARW